MFKEPTYEEYLKATSFARFKYKYGLIVSFAAMVCLVFLIFMIYSYGEEIASHPMTYAANKLDVVCTCVENFGDRNRFFANSTTLSYTSLATGGNINEFYRGVDSFEEEPVSYGS